MATAIIRGVVVAASSRDKENNCCDCFPNFQGKQIDTPPYDLSKKPLCTPENETFDFGPSSLDSSSCHCACTQCGTQKKSENFSSIPSTATFERVTSFASVNISTSTAFDSVVENHPQEPAIEPIEHVAIHPASLGRLEAKASPIFRRKSASTLDLSFSLRTHQPFYARQVLIVPQSIRCPDRVDRTALEAITMNVGSRKTNGQRSAKNNLYTNNAGMDINRNNGFMRNGAIVSSANVEKREHLYKILVIGELGTGKTSFIKRYVHQFFSQNYRATIGVDFALKVLHWDANTIVRLQLWDIAGQERFGNMTRVYYKEAVGAFIVFDVTRSGTFDCVSKWKEDLDSKVQLPDGTPIPCILLANKCDQEKQGVVTSVEKMDEYVRDNGFAGWFETSAKENINIDEAARALVNKILLNDKLISEADFADGEKFILNSSGDQTAAETKSKCSC